LGHGLFAVLIGSAHVRCLFDCRVELFLSSVETLFKLC
ncbi:MAG: hypothetical protein ACI90S_001498, partial [Marinobacter psychrophilus]